MVKVPTGFNSWYDEKAMEREGRALRAWEGLGAVRVLEMDGDCLVLDWVHGVGA